MNKIIDIEMTLYSSQTELKNINYNKETNSLTNKISFDCKFDDVKSILNENEYIDYNNINDNLIGLPRDHRIINIKITSFIGDDPRAIHYYASCQVNNIWINELNSNTRKDCSKIKTGININIWTKLDDFDIKYFTETKDEDALSYKSTPRINSIDKTLNAICEFINEFFDKEKFIICVKDMTETLTNEHIKFIENETNIKTFFI